MLWQCWRVFLAVLMASFLVAANRPDADRSIESQSTANSNLTKEAQQAANTIAEAIHAIHPSGKDSGCEGGKDRRDSDLCAQWKAADAADDAANYAFWTLFVSTIGTGLLVWTLWETRQTGRRELRAYVSVKPSELHLNSATGDVEARLNIRNDGSTPAHQLVHMGNFFVGDEEAAEREITRSEPRLRIGRPRPMSLPVGGELDGNAFRRHAPLTKEELTDIVSGKRSLYAFGSVEYKDTFGTLRMTRFCFIAELKFPDEPATDETGPAIAEMRWLLTPFYNDAT